MKHCPKCLQQFEDSLSFCLWDGSILQIDFAKSELGSRATLTEDDELQTVFRSDRKVSEDSDLGEEETLAYTDATGSNTELLETSESEDPKIIVQSESINNIQLTHLNNNFFYRLFGWEAMVGSDWHYPEIVYKLIQDEADLKAEFDRWLSTKSRFLIEEIENANWIAIFPYEYPPTCLTFSRDGTLEGDFPLFAVKNPFSGSWKLTGGILQIEVSMGDKNETVKWTNFILEVSNSMESVYKGLIRSNLKTSSQKKSELSVPALIFPIK